MSEPTGTRVLDGILWGGWRWVDPTGNDVSLTYYFDSSIDSWYTVEMSAARKALAEFSKVADISFRETLYRYDANLIEYTDNDLGGALGMHEPPEYATINWWNTWQEEGWFNWEGWSLPSSGLAYDPAGLARGGYGFSVMLHEFGHALGLGHPHDDSGGVGVRMPGVGYGQPYDLGQHDLNQGIYTVMSYNAGWADEQDPEEAGISEYGYNKGLAALDIAAIQYLYGADTNHKAGDTVYKMSDRGSWQSIWDTGGRDAIKYSGSGDAVIDLRSATLDESSSAGGYLSYIKNSGANEYFGGYTISGDFTKALPNKDGERGVVVEEAFGGSGDDWLRGNRTDNKLVGKGGDDRIIGSGGNDLLVGKSGHDVLIGGTGDDRMKGNGGIDEFHFRKGWDHDVIKYFKNGVDILVLNDNLWKKDFSIKKVIKKFAEVEDGGTILDFGRDELVLDRFKYLSADDIEIA